MCKWAYLKLRYRSQQLSVNWHVSAIYLLGHSVRAIADKLQQQFDTPTLNQSCRTMRTVEFYSQTQAKRVLRNS